MKAILVLNAGSSSLKFALFPINGELSGKPALSGQVEGIGAGPHLLAKDAVGKRYDERVSVVNSDDQQAQHRAALAHLFGWLQGHNPDLEIVAAGHRVVHGGDLYSAPVKVDDAILAQLDEFLPWRPAPASQPARDPRGCQPDAERAPGCLFRHRLPPQPTAAGADVRAAARVVGRRHQTSRYGFHGLSYEYVSRQFPALLGDKADGRVIVAHLGNGSSMCAIRNGTSVASSMGFTAVDGLVMGTRTGNLDPGVLLYLMEQKGMDVKALTNLLYKQSGLLGVSGISQDMRELLASEARKPARRWISTVIAPRARWVRWPPRPVASTHWCSPAGSANTRVSCARVSSSSAPGWAQRWTPPPTTATRPWSLRPTAR